MGQMVNCLLTRYQKSFQKSPIREGSGGSRGNFPLHNCGEKIEKQHILPNFCASRAEKVKKFLIFEFSLQI